jgi:hypothetical protein
MVQEAFYDYLCFNGLKKKELIISNLYEYVTYFGFLTLDVDL